MGDDEYRSPWLDWGEPVEPTTGKSWDDWGTPVNTPAPPTVQQPTTTTAAPETNNVVWTTSNEPVENSGNDVRYYGPNPPTVTATQAAPADSATITCQGRGEAQQVTVTRAADEPGTQTCEGRGEAQQTTYVANEPGNQTCQGRDEALRQNSTASQAANSSANANANASQQTGVSNVGLTSSTIPKTIEKVEVDPETGEKRVYRITNPAYIEAELNSPYQGDEPSTSGTGNTGRSANGGSSSDNDTPSIPTVNNNVPQYITKTVTDENGETKTVTIPNPAYVDGLSEAAGVGNAGASAGGGSPSYSGGSAGVSVTRQYDEPTGSSNVPQYIREAYTDENGETKYRTVPNPEYNAVTTTTGTSGVGNAGFSAGGGSPSFRTGGGSASTQKDAYYPDYASAHANIKGGEYKYFATNIRDTVETLQSQYTTLMNSMDGWEGQAKGSCQNATRSIQGKLTVIMNNINQSLIPACEAAEQLDEKLDLLEQEDEILKDLIRERDLREDEYIEAKAAYDAEPATTPTIKKDPETGEEKRTTETNPKKAILHAEMSACKDKWDTAIEEVEAQQQKEAEMCLEIDELIELIQTLQNNIETMNSYVNPSGSNYGNVSNSQNIYENYEDIINNLSQTQSQQSQTDYRQGDTVMFDDGFGYVYTVNQTPSYTDHVPGYDDSMGYSYTTGVSQSSVTNDVSYASDPPPMDPNPQPNQQ